MGGTIQMNETGLAHHYVADTHALIWHFLRDNRLSDEASRRFKSADDGEAVIFISAMTLIEIVYLREKGRIPASFLGDALDPLKTSKDGSYRVVPIDYSLSLALADVPRAFVPEMADRVIAATAYHMGLPLITKDKRIHDWKGIASIW